MFGWFKGDPSKRKLNPGNPGMTISFTVAFSGPAGNWEDKLNVVEEAYTVVKEAGYSVKKLAEGMQETTTGMVFQPRAVEVKPTEGRDVNLTTTVEIWHPQMFPSGIFEYQHTCGDHLEEEARKGFQQWAEVDLPVLLDAFEKEPQRCTAMNMTWDDDRASRRILLGPVFVMGQAVKDYASTGDEHPAFCNCCMFTNSLDAFRRHIESPETYAIRMFAGRVEEPMADCRINGEDWDLGKEALTNYAANWPDRGIEMRRQYMLIQNA